MAFCVYKEWYELTQIVDTTKKRLNFLDAGRNWPILYDFPFVLIHHETMFSEALTEEWHTVDINSDFVWVEMQIMNNTSRNEITLVLN